MLNDLLFSILPREGKSPIARDELKVKKIDKKGAIKQIDEEDEAYRPDKDDPREKKRQRRNATRDAQDQHDEQHQRDAQLQHVAKSEVKSPEQAPKGQAAKNTESDDPKFIDIEV
ncbi:hypothetical protein Patl_2879 [Paraglaciecola sp. T6c]|uniref:hypothetical protein n=1 Tax=Pseudoalteromonas atlantica (strain T6c / ATCC BAA-1087) TaxID=3042615 RepID=UPI00005C6E4A|nr:hypothetical protein [Paraglaciecola sp. T6c]ABG41387.1 hypothetical protein Patl_2879 [Paraglaciecola sp. T6c]